MGAVSKISLKITIELENTFSKGIKTENELGGGGAGF